MHKMEEREREKEKRERKKKNYGKDKGKKKFDVAKDAILCESQYFQCSVPAAGASMKIYGAN